MTNMTTKLANDNAVSPVIGVILILAITVILSAVVAGIIFNILPQNIDQYWEENITVIGVSHIDNGWFDQAYIITSFDERGFKTNSNQVYSFAQSHIGKNVTITYIEGSNHEAIVTGIKER